MIRDKPKGAVTYGIDIGKNLFHVVGVDSDGKPIQKVKFRRDTVLQFFERGEAATVGMEACPGSQWLARKLQECGHQVRIIPAQFVKPYVKSNKNDIIDAAAIAEAVCRVALDFAARGLAAEQGSGIEINSRKAADLREGIGHGILHQVKEGIADWRCRRKM